MSPSDDDGDEREGDDVEHVNPYDRSSALVWFWEDAVHDGNVLTQDGIAQIAHHKYQGGDYTHLDNIMNPFWNFCTERIIPLSMAPNMVTTLGGLACLASYVATWYYLPQFEEPSGPDSEVPLGLLLFNGFAILFYHTADCCDGKQARRTGTSSPLGQLFDHGLDCFATLTHLSVCQSILLMGPTRDYLWTQVGLQMAFFATQWEEYYTGVLQHSYGKWLGVTEVNYGLAFATLACTLFDEKTFFKQTLQQALLPVLPISILPDNPTSPSVFVTVLNTLLTTNLKHCLLVGWIAMVTSIVFGCMYRVAIHVNNSAKLVGALTKLISPAAVAAMMVVVAPSEAIQQEARLVSLSSGLCICLITVKIIVFSMARMAYGSIQKDILPTVVVLGFIAWEYEYSPHRRLKPSGLTLLLQALTAYYIVRIGYWASIAIHQLCVKLDVYLLTIKSKKA
jgi:ethanolaminephosphotransferase